jgi:tRNA (Thr-GGU) A37 N-methylase
MKAYYDEYTGSTCPDTMTVHEETREALVKYASPTGTFTVRVRQKPNPIGFHARLPGDRRK